MEKKADFLENRKADLKQLKYLATHKKDVYQSGRELGAPRKQLLLHDWDKFKPSKWGPYRDYWFGPQGAYTLGSRDKVPEDISKKFRAAADRHLDKRPHHQHKRSVDPVPMQNVPLNDRKEMLADWHSVSTRTSGKDPKDFPDVKTWAKKNNLGAMYKKASSDFNPDYTPNELERMGVYAQVYGDEPSEASMEEWPQRWLDHGPDKLGWLEWYKNYHGGRRLPQVDRKQIQRWNSFKARHGAQYKNNPTPRRKAALRNWAIDAEKLLNEKNASVLSRKVAQILRNRKNMPQVKDPKKIPTKTKKEVVNPKSLKPSQKSFNAEKVSNIKKELNEGTLQFKPLIVSKDNYILDGHHRWKASLTLWKQIPIIRLPKERKEALDYLKEKMEGAEKKARYIKPSKAFRQAQKSSTGSSDINLWIKNFKKRLKKNKK